MSSPTATPKEKKNSEEHSLQLDQNDVEYNNDYSLQKSNTDAVLNNPLYGLTRKQLFAKFEKFAADKNLSHEVETLKKGALVAQNPANFRSIDILTDEERGVIDHEYKNK
ncbi:unnamed protein product [Tilletia laevis]|uniref:Uncharacterized protein n=3 Tax=Tilletia TaxID=13289 RepID=A0A8X7MW43_9BASI|nr:hypothetical protein CF336_g2295 [Tilletia laevis]KAE8202578.1 hypothetical protein CF328_g2133 [Tilletia controversa]KAE8263305.1 hypothetical protein A4X03_0g1779 [Tilletia caries]KAE8206857.1 hypothetical protein CF335_g1563 [Tilletia laevis]KAE8251652.1 hypothetical protein A4X06_0g2593 [Tilletia controversa]